MGATTTITTKSKYISIDPGNSTAAYAAGDQVGSSAVRLPAVARGNGQTVVLQSVSIMDESGQNAETDIFLFTKDPTVTSGDNSAATVAASAVLDYGRCVWKVGSGDYLSLASNSIAKSNSNTGEVIQTDTASMDLWALVVTRGTPTYTSTSSLRINFGFLQD